MKVGWSTAPRSRRRCWYRHAALKKGDTAMATRSLSETAPPWSIQPRRRRPTEGPTRGELGRIRHHRSRSDRRRSGTCDFSIQLPDQAYCLGDVGSTVDPVAEAESQLDYSTLEPGDCTDATVEDSEPTRVIPCDEPDATSEVLGNAEDPQIARATLRLSATASSSACSHASPREAFAAPRSSNVPYRRIRRRSMAGIPHDQRQTARVVPCGQGNPGSYPLRMTLNLDLAGLPTLPARSVALIEIVCFLPLPPFDFAFTL